jgi:putative transposase
MPSYRRRHIPGAYVFITMVTHERRRVFASARWRDLLRECIEFVRKDHPFEMTAMALMPDHLHMLWKLPESDTDYSQRISLIKRRFTYTYLRNGGEESTSTTSRQRQRVRGVWEKRFWEHTIRDARDFHLHLDYIHMNPVKHGLASSPSDWKWSSFHRFVERDWYEPDWSGRTDLPSNVQYLWMDT